MLSKSTDAGSAATCGERPSIAAAPAWRSERGIAVLGPRHFGFDVEYRGLAERLPFP